MIINEVKTKISNVLNSGATLDAFNDVELINYTEINRDCLNVNGHSRIEDILPNKESFKEIWKKLVDPGSFNPKEEYYPENYFLETDVYLTIEKTINEIIKGSNFIRLLTGAKSIGKTLSQNICLKRNDSKLEENNIFWVRCDCEKLVKIIERKKENVSRYGIDEIESYLNIQFLHVFSKYYKSYVNKNETYFYKRDFFRNAFEQIKSENVNFLIAKDYLDSKSYKKVSVNYAIEEYNEELWRLKNSRRNSEFHHGRDIILQEGRLAFEKWNTISSEIQLLLKDNGYRFIKIIDGIDNYKKYNHKGEHNTIYSKVLNHLALFCDSYINSNRREYESVIITLRRNTYYDFYPIFRKVKRMDHIQCINMNKDTILEKKQILKKRKVILESTNIDKTIYRIFALISNNLNNNDFVWKFLDADKHIGYYIKNNLNLLAAVLYFKDKYKLNEDDDKMLRFINEYQPVNLMLNGQFGLNSFINEKNYSIDDGKMLFNIFYYDKMDCQSAKWHGLCTTRIIQHLQIKGNLKRSKLIDDIVSLFKYERTEVIKQISKLLDFSFIRLNEYEDDKDTIERDPNITTTSKGRAGLKLIYSNCDILYHCSLNTYLPSKLIQNSFISSHSSLIKHRNYAINCLKSTLTFVNFIKSIDIIERKNLKTEDLMIIKQYALPLCYENVNNNIIDRLFSLSNLLNDEVLTGFNKFLDTFSILPEEQQNYNELIKSTNEISDLLYQMAEDSISEKNYKKAAEYFTKTKDDILSVYVKYFDRGGREIISSMLDYDSFFSEITSELSHNNIKYENCKNIYIKSLDIIKLLHVCLPCEDRISHYTKEKIADELILNSNSMFRLYSSTYVNDLEEGIRLLEYLGIDKLQGQNQLNNYRAFLGCFTFDNDILTQFRLYGKKDLQEATGVSIMLKKEYFSNDIKRSTKQDTNEINNLNNPNKFPLFRCIYICDDSNRITSIAHRKNSSFNSEIEYNDYMLHIESLLAKLKIELADLKILIANSGLNDDLISKLLINLRYLIKSTGYEEEQECRILRIESLLDKKCVYKENVEDGEKYYLNYLNIQEYAKEVCFASKKNINSFRDSLKSRGLQTITVKEMKHPFKN